MKATKYICPKCGNDKFNLFNPEFDHHLEEIIIVCENCNTNYVDYKFDKEIKFEDKDMEICTECFHEICPHCGDWCDTILYSKDDKGNHCDVKDENDYPHPCCSGTCTL